MAGEPLNRQQRRQQARKKRNTPTASTDQDLIDSFVAHLNGAGSATLGISDLRDRLGAGVHRRGDEQAWANAEALAAQVSAEAASTIGEVLIDFSSRRLTPSATAIGLELGEAAGHAFWLGYASMLETVAAALNDEAALLRSQIDAVRAELAKEGDPT